MLAENTVTAIQKERRTLNKADTRALVDCYAEYAPAPGETRKVQIIRPFAVLSKNTYSAPVQPPIGIAYLGAVLERAGYRVSLLDSIGENIFRIERCGEYNLQGLTADEILARIDPDAGVIGISLLFSLEWLQQRELIRAIRRRFPQAVIVVGGEHPTAMAEYVLRDCPDIDFAVTGEGDLTFLNLVHNVFYGKQTDAISGTAFIDVDGHFVDNGLSRRLTTVDDLPRPAWHLLPIANYFIDNWTGGISFGRNMIIMGTRGCPYQCTFCSNPGMWTTRYQMRDYREVVEEIEWLIQTYQCNSIDFCDLTAFVKKDWVLNFCAELKRRNINIVWQLPSGTRSEALDTEALTAIYEAGCRLLVFAPESGSEATLKRVKKKISLSKLTASIKEAARIGHTVKANLVIGFPGDTVGDVVKTFFYAIKLALLGAADCNIAIFTPYPGSELYHDLRADGTIGEINDEYFHNLLVQFDFTSSASYCKDVPGWMLALVRLVGQSAFYVTAYARHPSRLWRLYRNLRGEKFKAQNLFEQRIHDMVVRRRLG